MKKKERPDIDPLWIKEEVWKLIPNTDGLYEASSFGKIRRVGAMVVFRNGWKRYFPGHELKLQLCCDSRQKRKPRNACDMCIKGRRVRCLVAHCVASAFLGMPFQPADVPTKEKATVNHIDENPLNDHVDNLEWVSWGDNVAKYKWNHAKRVVVLTKETGDLKLFTTGHEASLYMGKTKYYIAEKLKRKEFETDKFAWFIGFVPGSKQKGDIWTTLE